MKSNNSVQVMDGAELRRFVGKVGRQYRMGELSWEQFMDLVPEQGDLQDEDISELIDLIEHEPKKGGLFGVSEKEYGRHVSQVDALIEKLLSSTNP